MCAPLRQRLRFTQSTQETQRTSSLQQTSHQPSEQLPKQQTDRPSAELSISGNSLAAADPTLLISTPCSHTTATASPIQLLGVGCLWAILEEAHITTLAIEPSYQRQKLGSLMLSQLLLAGHRRGLHHATLEVRASNQQALRLYQKFDFKEAGQRPRYYSDGENARILWRSGLQQPNCITQLRNYQEAAIAHLETTGKYQFFAEST